MLDRMGSGLATIDNSRPCGASFSGGGGHRLRPEALFHAARARRIVRP